MKTPKIYKLKVKGFTLMELLVTLALIGALILMALPLFMPLISKTKATEAQLQLKYLLQLEKSYFFIHSKYSTDLGDVGFEQPKLVTQDGRANYKIEVTEASNRSFKGVATAVTDFDQDGQFNVWEIDNQENLKEIIKD